jgi:hypothetical protein
MYVKCFSACLSTASNPTIRQARTTVVQGNDRPIVPDRPALNPDETGLLKEVEKHLYVKITGDAPDEAPTAGGMRCP